MLLSSLSDPFFLSILVAGLLIGMLTGFTSVFVVARHLSFLGEGLGHGSLLGIAIAVLVGVSPWTGAFFFSILAAIILAVLDHQTRLRSDIVLAVLFSTFLGLGVILFQQSTSSVSIHEVLFGNLLLISAADRNFLLFLCFAIPLLGFIFRNAITLFLVDEGLLKRHGYSAKLIHVLLYVVIAIVVAASLKVCGALLTTALLTVPGAIAIPRSRSLTQAVLASSIVGVASVLMGILSSWIADTPPGATTAVAAGVLFFLSSVFFKGQRLK